MKFENVKSKLYCRKTVKRRTVSPGKRKTRRFSLRVSLRLLTFSRKEHIIISTRNTSCYHRRLIKIALTKRSVLSTPRFFILHTFRSKNDGVF